MSFFRSISGNPGRFFIPTGQFGKLTVQGMVNPQFVIERFSKFPKNDHSKNTTSMIPCRILSPLPSGKTPIRSLCESQEEEEIRLAREVYQKQMRDFI